MVCGISRSIRFHLVGSIRVCDSLFDFFSLFVGITIILGVFWATVRVARRGWRMRGHSLGWIRNEPHRHANNQQNGHHTYSKYDRVFDGFPEYARESTQYLLKHISRSGFSFQFATLDCSQKFLHERFSVWDWRVEPVHLSIRIQNEEGWGRSAANILRSEAIITWWFKSSNHEIIVWNGNLLKSLVQIAGSENERVRLDVNYTNKVMTETIEN